MLLIVISWIYIFFTTINFGFLSDRILKLKTSDFILFPILGLFFVTLLTTSWAIFGRIHIEFHLFLLSCNILIAYRFRIEIASLWDGFKRAILQLDSSFKFLLSAITLLIIAQCASVPYLIDNESYYIQTIKWINEYGLVKGVSNLHLFLAQCSGWHIAQSAFSFSFVYGSFNDLSGFCLLLGNFFAITKLGDYINDRQLPKLIAGLLPCANLLLFQFISAPSPDIPVYIISFIVFWLLLENYAAMSSSTFKTISLLVIFVVFIKTTAVGLCLIPLLLLVQNFRRFLPQLSAIAGVGFIALVLFAIKNIIISGYPFFPVTANNFLHFEHSLPQGMAELYYRETAVTAYFITQTQYEAMKPIAIFIQWLTLPKLHGLFNMAITALILICPFAIYWKANHRAYWIIYVTLCLQMLLLFLSSPQYRFFLHFVLFFSFFCAALLIRGKRVVVGLLTVSTIGTAFILFVPISLNVFTKNKFTQVPSTFSVANIIFPHGNSKSETAFELIQNGNLDFYSPIQNEFFYSTGDGTLPCVNKDQLEFFEKHFGVVPQLRSGNLKDGFVSKHK